MEFNVEDRDTSTAARTGALSLRSGTVQTPLFMPVGTKASVKGLTTEQLRDCGTQMVLANTYHLALRPGAELIERLGGLHGFMSWDGPVLTDSGGYQVFSLSELNEVTDEGVRFKSPLDGSSMFLGPAEAMRIQEQLGADVAMVFDECPPYPCSRETAASAVERTLRWARACLGHHRRPDQAVFGIVQGSVFEDLRERCAEELRKMDFPGYAVGGVSVGEEDEERHRMVAFTTPLLPEDKPRYLMGVGFPVDVVNAIAEGIDMFDCVAPTRMGRNATAFTEDGRLRIRNSRYREDTRPLEEACECPCCRLYCRSYVHHLFRCDEMLGPVLLSLHNLSFYHRLFDRCRQAIEQGRFDSFRSEFVSQYQSRKEP